MKEATRGEAASIAQLLDVNKQSVWEIIKGMQYSTSYDLAMAVHRAFAVVVRRPMLSSLHKDVPASLEGYNSDDETPRGVHGGTYGWISSNCS